MKRGLGVGLSLAAVAGSAIVGWQAGRQIQSPAEAAASAQPPEPSLITVEVQEVELATRLIVRGDIVYDEPETISLSGSLGPTVEAPVVTRVIEQGAIVEEGDLALEIAGRPVMYLQGEIPMYRDLRPGSSGVDVEQLELALARLGYFSGTPDDAWDSGTGKAIEAWYATAGYQAEGPTEPQLAEIDGSRSRVNQARDSVTNAEKSLTLAKEGPAESIVLAQESQVTSSEEFAASAVRQQTTANEEQLALIESAVAAKADAEKALDEATVRRDQAVEDDVHPDTGLPPTPDELAQLEGEVVSASADLAAAVSAVTAAEASAAEVEIEQAALVRQADDAVAIAKAQLAELLAPPDTSFELSALSAAKDDLSDAQNDLAQLLADYGTWLPAGQVVFLDFMPVRVDRQSVERGDIVSGSFMTVSGSDLTIASSVPDRDSANVPEGLTVIIEDRVNDADIEAVIVRKGLRAGTNGVAEDRVYIELESADIPPELVGANVKITIPLSTTGGAVLAVPAAALSATADGSSRVEIDAGDGTTRFVIVEPGLSTGGLVEVTPVDGDLQAGDLVVVGYAPDS